ncbi:glycoside hydrolase family 76 [Brachybacterium ginsengisoli]|uniref:Glycoside hydrolase family 76 n=1 Tax=Brachybacterium ginsengisoli TaxID=1331682 RepID=A0A291GTI4_9MICO|nr:glycoside hydrolase family 76 protein [Brachybacterium ginsengisoli]ATG53426.1 glycoside hydrolase family 76 [Brachybacterium ginsengisoli]
MTMTRRTLATLSAAAVPILGLAPAAWSAPPGSLSAGGDASRALSRARAAAEVLMADYDPDKAWFPSSWWNSAVALQTIGDYMLRSGDLRFLDQLERTFERNKGPFPAGELSGDEIYGSFCSRAIDDSGWWALTWMRAYDLTGEQKHLDMAVTIGEFMSDFWDPSTCGGGIWWDEERTYKNAVTNGQWIRLTAQLHARIPGDRQWLERALEAWEWYAHGAMIGEDGLLNDGLTDACENNHDRVYTYNQGLAIGGALELWRATGDETQLERARCFADSALAEGALVEDGILVEWTDALGESTNDNHKQFKGIFLRYLMDLADTTGDARYREFVARQAASIWERDRTLDGRLGVRWSGEESADSPNVADWRTQASALSALIADLPADGADSSLTAALTQPSVVIPDGEPTASSLQLEVTATTAAARKLVVHLEVEAPDGWIVDLASRIRLDLPGGDAVVAVELPLTVTIPPDAADGVHEISVRARTSAQQDFTAGARVVVAREIAFAGGTEDGPWLWEDRGSGVTDEPGRFADGTSSFTYRFPFPAGTTTAQATVTISNQFVVELSADGSEWTSVLRETEQIRDASNRGDRTLDLTPYLGGEDKDVYLRVSDAFAEDGWGGQVHRVTAEHSAG